MSRHVKIYKRGNTRIKIYEVGPAKKATKKCRKKKSLHAKGMRKKKLKKVIRKNGKRYYRAGKSGLVKLKGNEKPPAKR